MSIDLLLPLIGSACGVTIYLLFLALRRTRRDFLAAQAMVALVTSSHKAGSFVFTPDKVVVETAYALADAMLKAREQ